MSGLIPVLIVTGPVGVGKSSVLGEIASLLEAAGVGHAEVDMDALRGCWPGSPGDRFQVGLGLRNLAAIWPNFRAAGATRLVVADVVEDRAELAGYRRAVPGAEITVVRLAASPATLAERVRRRELGAGLEWHLARAQDLAALMAERRVEDFVVETDGRSLREIAAEALRRAGWQG